MGAVGLGDSALRAAAAAACTFGAMAFYSLMDLFAGCGGMTAGFEQTGRFHSIMAVESERDAASTWALNFGNLVATDEGGGPLRIEEVSSFPKVDVVIGGPPCQGFSPLNMTGVGLDRRGLWRQYLRALRESEACAFVMENVPELLRSAEYTSFRRSARRLGYEVEGRILNAADYGVPQKRRRAIVIGIRNGELRWPAPTHADPDEAAELGRLPWRTFRDAVRGLPLQPTGTDWHNPRNPRTVSLERYRTIPAEGENRFDLAARRPDITPDCWLRKPTGTTDVFGRLWWDRPAFTIRTEFFKPEKGRYLHPSEHRPITVREAARCMSFPDEFRFPAPEDQSMTSVARQIGNAVPPVLAAALGETLAGALDSLAESSATAQRLAA